MERQPVVTSLLGGEEEINQMHCRKQRTEPGQPLLWWSQNNNLSPDPHLPNPL